jgi:flagellar hook-associated protein 1 FlgK
MGVLTIGTQALQANMLALQTAGNNIANVNTPGYSTQKVILSTVQGQYAGNGYVGKGVAVETITRSFDAFLTRQAALSGSVAAGDTLRADYLKQIGSIFQGGPEGLGAAINDMMNAFSDVASTPTDMTARTVLLTRVEEAARRMRTEPLGLDDLMSGLKQSLQDKVNDVNTLAQNIADVNEQIARALGRGQPPNDLLDRRDYLISSLNKLVQTTQIPASDGTIGVFVGGSQSLVLGHTAAKIVITGDEFQDPQKSKIALMRNGVISALDENTLGGGEVPALLKVQNNDMNEARNLLGRITAAVTTTLNQQHRLGIDLNGNPGGDLLTPIASTNANVLVPDFPVNAGTNAIAGALGITMSIPKDLVPSDYEINFATAAAPPAPGTGTIQRKSDGKVTAFEFTPGTPPARGTFAFQTSTDPATGPFTGTTIDGLSLDADTTTDPGVGARFLLKPYSTVTSNVAREFSTPSALAVGNPLAVTLTPTNKGSLAVSSLMAKTMPTTAAAPIQDYTVQFTVTPAGTFYDIIDTTAPLPPVVSGQPYTSGQAISYTPAGAPGFSLTLTGAPANNDTLTVKQNPYATLSGGNATAMMNLRDQVMFDGASMSDGYAGLISQIGIRSQSANYSAQVSSSIAVNAEKNRAGVSGVNLDEEAAKLLQYQQAYQASAKMIQISQSIFDTLLQGMGR